MQLRKKRQGMLRSNDQSQYLYWDYQFKRQLFDAILALLLFMVNDRLSHVREIDQHLMKSHAAWRMRWVVQRNIKLGMSASNWRVYVERMRAKISDVVHREWTTRKRWGDHHGNEDGKTADGEPPGPAGAHGA
jgi:hypothetical protein